MASVLIVDDQDMVRRTLRLALESEDLDVREAGDGDEALRMYSLAPADVVVIDIVMPNKEGIETIFELRRSAPRVKIIAMSGRDTVDFLDMARKLGADHVLRKPFEMRTLVDLVHSCLGAAPGSSAARQGGWHG
jgi:DNA-binding response OmpR family regulator